MSSAEAGTASETNEYGLIKNDALPLSEVDRRFVKVVRGHKVYFDKLPAPLNDLSAKEWKNGKFLKETFKTPPTGKQRTHQKQKHNFPYCVLTYGAAATSPRERLIVINWWANLSDAEQKEWTEIYKEYFIEPSVSSTLYNEFDPENPNVAGAPRSNLALIPHVNSMQSCTV